MTKSRYKKRFTSILLALMIFVSMLPLGALNASAADSLSINYSFAYTNAGYAEGKVKLTGSSDDYGKYYLYWADDTKALDGYSEITSMTLSSSSKSFTFEEFTAIPAGATKLIAIKSSSEPTNKTVTSADAVYTIPESKQFKHSSSEKTYSFQALSDIHIDKQSNVYYPYSELHFEQALECASDRNVDFVTVCGDMINGYESSYVKEWQAYQKIIANSSYCNPIYECSGNHEIKSQLTYGLDTFKTGTGLDTSTSAMSDEPYFEITAENGDHFIFMCLELDDSPNLSDEFTTAQMNWLKELLAEYHDDGHNIFIYEHALISKYGAGDDKDNPYYGGGLSQSYPAVQELIGLLEKYPDVFFISGHTHLDFKYGYNIDNRDGTTAYTIHIPSTSSTTKITNGSMDYTMSEDSSQGYFVDVYGDCVIFNGTDLTKNTIYPAYTYIIDQSGKDPSEGDDDDDNDTEMLSVTVDVSNVAQNVDTVYCYTFDSTGVLASKSNKMTANADGTYSVNVSSDYDKMYFVINDSNLGKIGTNNYPVDNCFVVIGSEKITYSAPSSWGSNVYVYVWSDSNQLFSWPGIKMTLDSSTGDYYAYIPEDTYTYVIFNDGNGTQTDDLKIDSYVSEGIAGSYTVIKPYQLGDANLDGNIDIKDATFISKAAAQFFTLTDEQKTYADTSCDGEITITDATYIQKYLTQLIDSFPEQTIQSTILLTASSSSSLDTMLEKASTFLQEDYRYASFDAYMALKKAYNKFLEVDINSASSEEYEAFCTELETALENFETLKANNNIITVYFTDNKSWGGANAYVWDDSGNALQKWGGQAMTYIKKNSLSQSIYAITLNQSVWKNIIFNKSSSQTVNITLTSTHNTGYYLSSKSNGKYTVKTYTYSE